MGKYKGHWASFMVWLRPVLSWCSPWGCHHPHLIGNHDQRVLVLRQEVEEAPEAEGILIGEHAVPVATRPVVLLGRQGPAQLIKVLLNKSPLLHLPPGLRSVKEAAQPGSTPHQAPAGFSGHLLACSPPSQGPL